MEKRETENRRRCTMIVLAGGSGRRMGADRPKQFLKVNGKPLIWYALHAVEQSPLVDDCILVAAKGELPYVETQILDKYDFRKVMALAEGGRERFESVIHGLQKLREIKGAEKAASRIVMIHDGARPFLTEEIIEACFWGAEENGACVAAVPSKDTVAISDGTGIEVAVPDRRLLYQVQTPQSFRGNLAYEAFDKLAGELRGRDRLDDFSWITDDASVVAHYSGFRIRLVEGDYRNIKVTTAEDLPVAELFLPKK